jgi:hypothetical protein
MSSEPLDPAKAYYYNTRTGEVEQGLVSDWSDRMGPYRTADEAANALATAQRRNTEWDQADRDWDGDDA